MSLLEEIIAAGKETISDIKNIPAQIKESINFEWRKKQMVDQWFVNERWQIIPQKKNFFSDIDTAFNIGTNFLAQSSSDIANWVWKNLEKNVKEKTTGIPTLEKYTDAAWLFIADKLQKFWNTKRFQDNIQGISEFYSDDVKALKWKEFEYSDVFKPAFWTSTVSEQVPTLMAYLLPGTYIAKLPRLWFAGKAILGAITSRVAETTQNASQTFRNVYDQTWDVDTANKAATDVAKDSALLLASDPAQFAIDFLPAGKWVLSKVIKIWLSAGIESAEELYTLYSQNNAERRARWEKEQTVWELIRSSEGKQTIAVSWALWGLWNLTVAKQYWEHAGFTQDEEAMKDAEKNLTPEEKEAFDDGFDEWEKKLVNDLMDVQSEVKTEEDQKIVSEVLPAGQMKLFNELDTQTSDTEVSLLDEKSINQIQNNFDSATIKTRPQILVNWLKSLGLKVSTEKSPKSDSIYLKLKNKWAEWGPLVTIRLSDHQIMKKPGVKQKKADFSIDIWSTNKIPFEDIVAKTLWQQIAEQPKTEVFKDSADAKNFRKNLSNFTNEDLVAYAQSKNQAITDIANQELTNRWVTPEEVVSLAETITPKEYSRKQSILEEVETAPLEQPTRKLSIAEEVEQSLPIDVLNTNPFTGETIKPTIQSLYEEWNAEAIKKEVWEGWIFVVKEDDKAPILDSAEFVRMSDEEYNKTKLKPLKEWEVAYKVYTPFTDTVLKTGDLVLKSWLWMQKGKKFKNLGIALAQSAYWAPFFDIISPAITLSQKFSVGWLKFFWVKNILGLIIDPKTGYDGRAIEQQAADKAVIDRIWFLKKFGGQGKIDNIFSLSEELNKAWIKLVPEIRNIISTTETKNSITGEIVSPSDMSQKTIDEMVSSVLARAAYNYSYDSLTEYNQAEREVLKINDALSHMAFYYPEQVKKIVWNEVFDLLYNNLDYSKNNAYDAYDFWGKVLVEKWALRPTDLAGTRKKFVTVQEISPEKPAISAEDLAYEPYVINRNDVTNILSYDMPDEFDTIEQYIDYLKVIRNTGITETNTGKNIDSEIKRFEDTILKKKWEDSLDFFRLKSPVGQMIHYGNHLSRVVYQDSMMKLFSAVEKLLPGNLKTKLAWNYIGLIEDTFSTSFRPKSMANRSMDMAIYWETKTEAWEAKKNTAISAINQATAFAFATVDNMTQALGTLAIVYPDPRIYLMDIKGKNDLEKVFIENSVGQSRKLDIWKPDESFMKRNTLARIRAAQAKEKTWNNTAPAFDKDGKFSWVNTGNILSEKIGLMPLIGFGNTIEQTVSQKAAMLSFTEAMQKETGKDYKTWKLSIDWIAVAKDFNELTPGAKERVLNATRKTINRNFSSQRTWSSVKLMNYPGMNVLRGWVNKFITAHALRRLDERSFWMNKISMSQKEIMDSLPMQDELFESQKFMLQYAAAFSGITMGLATLIYMAQLEWDEDDEEKRNAMLTSVLTAWNWMWSGLLDIDGFIIRNTASPVSTSTGFISQVTSSLKDLIVATITKNDFALQQVRRDIFSLFWMAGQIVNAGIDFNDSVANWSSFGNINSIKENTFAQTALNNLLPGNFDAAKAKAIERTLKSATDDGRYFLLDMIGDIVSMRSFQAEMSFKNMFWPLLKVSTGKQAETFEKAQVIKDYYDYVAEHGQSRPFNEVALEYLSRNPDFYAKSVPLMKNVRDFVSARSKESLKLARIWEDVDVLKERWFSYAKWEPAITTLNRIRENPEIEAALAEKIYGLTLRWTDSMDRKDYIKKSLSSPDSRSSTMDALALVNENNRYMNRLKRSFNTYFFNGEENSPWYDINVVDEVTDLLQGKTKKNETQSISGTVQMLDDMEAILAFASKNPAVEQDVMTSLQIVGAKNVKNRLYKLSEQWLFEPEKYPNVFKAFLQLQDESTATYSEGLKDSKFDHEVVAKVNKPLEKEPIEIPRSYEEGDAINAPYYGTVQVNKGKVLIQDVLGRAFTFTNIDTDMKNWDVVDPGQKIGTVKKWGTITNRFNKKGEAENLNNELAPLLNPDNIFSPSYLKSLAIDPIDFYALSRSISTTKKQKWAKTSKLVNKIPSPKSILEEIMANS